MSNHMGGGGPLGWAHVCLALREGKCPLFKGKGNGGTHHAPPKLPE